MKHLISTAAVALGLALAGPALAQQQADPAQPQPDQQTQAQPAQPDQQAQTQPGAEPQQPQQPQQAQLSQQADGIVGKKAMSQQGKEIGSIEDVLVGQDGKVQAMVLEHDRAKRAVPWDQVQMQGDQVTVNMSEQQLSQLPEYKAEKE